MPSPDLTTGQKAYLLGKRIRPWAGIFLAAVLGYTAIALFPSNTVEKDKPSLENRVKKEYETYRVSMKVRIKVPKGQLAYIRTQVDLTEKAISHKQYERCTREWIWMAAVRNPDGNYSLDGEYVETTKDAFADIPALIRKYNQYAQENHRNK